MLAQLEQQKTEALGAVEGWSPARLAYRTAPDTWSTVEIFDHLVKTETGILTATKQGLEDPHRIGVRDRAGFMLIDRVFRSQRKVKVPASASQVLPDAGVSLESIIGRWNDTRSNLQQVLAQLTPDQFQGGVFRHPVSGWMSVPQVLSFFSVHILHHSFQLTRLREASQHL